MNYDRAAIEAMVKRYKKLGTAFDLARECRLVLDWLELAAEVERLKKIIQSLKGEEIRYDILRKPEPCYCGPPCGLCGAITYPSGRCHLCPSCGTSDGCS